MFNIKPINASYSANSADSSEAAPTSNPTDRLETSRRGGPSTPQTDSTPTPRSPHGQGSGRNKPLQERAAHLVEDPASLVVPKSLGGLGLEAVGAAARKQGLHWFRENEIDALLPKLERLRKRVHQPLDLPDAYLKGFHGFPPGANMQYLHALNMESAMAQFAGLSCPEDGVGAAARQRMLKLTADQIRDYLGAQPVHTMVDIGCGTGVTTRAFAEHIKATQTTGLDASDYMLAEAQRLQEDSGSNSPNIEWRHALAQQTKFPDASQDLVTVAFMCHEQRKDIMDEVLRESYRVLKPGGVLAISDYDTQRPLVQFIAHAPAVVVDLASALIFEPHLKDYLHTDFAAKTAEVGFVDYKVENTCKFVQMLLARKPPAATRAQS